MLELLVGTFGLSFVVFITLFLLILPVMTFWSRLRLVKKMGYSGLLAVAWMIPVVNGLVTFYLAQSNWPLEQETQRQRQMLSGQLPEKQSHLWIEATDDDQMKAHCELSQETQPPFNPFGM